MRVVVVPGLPALLPSYGSLVDPVPELRAACHDAVAWLVDGAADVTVRGDPLSSDDMDRGLIVPLAERVGGALLASHGVVVSTSPTGGGEDERILVVANGSGCRSEKAPGHLDERSWAFDEALGSGLAAGDVAALRDLDADLGAELLATGIPALQGLPQLPWRSTIDWAGDPFGVQYWVVRWQSGS